MYNAPIRSLSAFLEPERMDSGCGVEDGHA